MRKYIEDNPNCGLSFLYNTIPGRILLKPLVSSSFISNLVGSFMESKASKILIKPFIKKYNIDLSLYKNNKYSCFNDFFIRKLKDEHMIIENNKDTFMAPCDAKLTCYKINDNTLFTIKNSTYSVSSLINNESVAKEFKNGYVLVFRLSPEDYHRYYFVDDGMIIKNYEINGKYHTVNPIVYDKFKVFKENTRECTIINTKNFSKLIYVEVGALLVGKINNHKKKGSFNKNEEKGYFMYGGSTVVILVKENIIKLNDEIINNSSNGIETYVKYKEEIGKKIFK